VSHSSAKQALVVAIGQNRATVIRDFRTLKNELNVAKKLRGSVRKNPSFWLGGAATASFLFGRLFGRQRTSLSAQKKGPFARRLKFLKWGGMSLLALARFIIPVLIKPAITAYTQGKIYKKNLE
jgi:hypothetical protein